MGCRCAKSLTPIRVPTTCPTAHQRLNSVKRYCFAPGKNSINIVPSTGKFPPTPKPVKAIKTQKTVKLGAAPATRPKTPPTSKVQFQANRRLQYQPSSFLYHRHIPIPERGVTLVMYTTTLALHPLADNKYFSWNLPDNVTRATPEECSGDQTRVQGQGRVFDIGLSDPFFCDLWLEQRDGL